MKKLVIALMLAVGLAACDNKETPAVDAKPTVKIGVSLPLTGNMAFAGENMRASLEMALQDLSKDKLKYNYEIIFEDDQYEIKKAVLNYNRFINLNKVNALMSFWGTMGNIASRQAQDNKILHMSCSLSNNVGKGLYNFNHSTKLETQANAFINFYKKHNYKKIAMVYYNCIELEEFLPVLKEKLKNENIEIVYELMVNPGDTDFAMQIYQMMQTNPEVLHLQLLSPSAEAFAKRAKEKEMNLPIVNLNDLLAVPEYYNNAYIVTEDSGTNDFISKFKQRTGLDSIGCTANLYDGFNMIVQGFEKAGDGKTIPTNEVVANTMLNNKDIKTVMNKIDMDKEGNIDTPSVLKQIKNGKPVKLEK